MNGKKARALRKKNETKHATRPKYSGVASRMRGDSTYVKKLAASIKTRHRSGRTYATKC